VGLDDTYADSGAPEDPLKKCGLTAAHITAAAVRAADRKAAPAAARLITTYPSIDGRIEERDMANGTANVEEVERPVLDELDMPLVIWSYRRGRGSLNAVEYAEGARHDMATAGNSMVLFSSGSKVSDEDLMNKARTVMEAGATRLIRHERGSMTSRRTDWPRE
jgi:hypothetical protein